MLLKSLITFSLIIGVLISSSLQAKVTDSRYGIYDEKIRIVLLLSHKKDFKVSAQRNKIVVDIFEERHIGTLKLPKSVKYSVRRHNWGIRIVLHYPKKFSLKYFYLDNPHRIVLDIYKEENDLYTELMEIIGDDTKKVEVTKTETKQASLTKDPIGELLRDILSKPLIYKDKVIVIDAGHGGKDPGAIGYRGIKEKHVNLAIAKKVAYFLRKDGRFKVILTRRGDYFIPLHKRAEIALKNRADLFISIHADAAPRKNPRARGTQVFALSYRKAVEKKSQILKNRRYARLVLGEGANNPPVVKKVLVDLAMDTTLYESFSFAGILSKELRKVVGKDVYFRGIKRAGFVVLKTPGIPSVLVETGFITNPREARKLRNPEFQRKVAWSIYRAVVRYFYGDDFGQKLVKYR